MHVNTLTVNEYNHTYGVTQSHENETSVELKLAAAFTLLTGMSYVAKVRQKLTNSSSKVRAFKINTNSVDTEKIILLGVRRKSLVL